MHARARCHLWRAFMRANISWAPHAIDFSLNNCTNNTHAKARANWRAAAAAAAVRACKLFISLVCPRARAYTQTPIPYPILCRVRALRLFSIRFQCVCVCVHVRASVDYLHSVQSTERLIPIVASICARVYDQRARDGRKARLSDGCCCGADRYKSCSSLIDPFPTQNSIDGLTSPTHRQTDRHTQTTHAARQGCYKGKQSKCR